MKLSISVRDEDVEIIDRYAQQHGLPSRSAVVHKAISLLRHPTLEEDYAASWQEWEESGEAAIWDDAVGDGLGDASR